MEVVLAKLKPKGIQVQSPKISRQLVPWYELVDEVEETDQKSISEA